MSEILRRIQTLVLSDDFRVSEHGFDELQDDDILIDDLVSGIIEAIAIEDYRDRARGPSVLALQYDSSRRAIHVVWALPAGERRPAVLVTAYRPHPDLWDADFKQRVIR